MYLAPADIIRIGQVTILPSKLVCLLISEKSEQLIEDCTGLNSTKDVQNDFVIVDLTQ